MSQEAERVTTPDGVELVAHFLGGEGPPVMLAHATGFHGRCWIPVAKTLAPEFSVWALDQRGHGASGKSPDRSYPWPIFADDLLMVIHHLDQVTGNSRPWRAGGHSMGGAVSVLAEAKQPGTFSAMCAYEPVVLPPAEVLRSAGSTPPGDGPGEAPGLAALARRRRPVFASRQAALDNYRAKPPFRLFDPEAIEAYVEWGFVDRPDGTVTLACDREDEATVFDNAATSGAWDAASRVSVPVAVLAGGAGMDLVGRLAPLVARHLRRGGYREMAGLDHFGPMTAPAEVGALMARALRVGADADR